MNQVDEPSPKIRPEPALTSQQEAAIHTEGVSISLSAGAGCGKTFVLTRRFLKELEPGGRAGSLGRLVAITFTERAARELRDRIRSRCREMLATAAAADAEHWLDLLRSIDTARVGTIHSFCASILRDAAVESEIDPAFGLLEPQVEPAVRSRAVRSAVTRLLEEDDADLAELVFQYGFDKAVTILEEMLSADTKAASDPKVDEIDDPGEIVAAWTEQWAERSVPILTEDFLSRPKVLSAFDLLSIHDTSNAVMQQRRATILATLAELRAGGSVETALADLADAAVVKGGGGKGAWVSEEVYEEIKDGLSDLRDEIKKLKSGIEFELEQAVEGARLGLIAQRVLNEVRREFRATKRELGVLDFDDLLTMTRDVLKKNEAVRRRVAAGIDLLMVDEFQDTDPVQAEIVSLICGNDLTRGKLFVVGDFKQSIYRFRGADPTVFAKLRGSLDASGQLSLSRNFRSRDEILRFANTLFAAPIGSSYEPLIAGTDSPPLSEPPIELLLPRGSDPAESSDDKRKREADAIARRIKQLIDDQIPRIRDHDGLRPVRPGDICILFRVKSHFPIYEEALRRASLGYYLVGSKAFYAQQEVNDVAMLCRWLAEPEDVLSLAGVLRSPLFGLDDEMLLALRDAGSTIDSGLFGETLPELSEQQAEQVRFAAQTLEELRFQKDRLPIRELLELAIDRTCYDGSMLLEKFGPRKVANLRKLLSMAAAADRSGIVSLGDFAARIGDAILEQADEELAATEAEGGDVIRLMSIHQSKGLEFPVVVLADMDWQDSSRPTKATIHAELGPLVPTPSKESSSHLGVMIHKVAERRADRDETVRLLYVAATRAADHLILSAALPPDGRFQSPWLKLIADKYDLETGLPFDSDADAPTAKLFDAPPDVSFETTARRTDTVRLCDLRETLAATEPERQIALTVPTIVRSEWSVTALTKCLSAPSLRKPVGQSSDQTPSSDDSLSDEPRDFGSAVHHMIESADMNDTPERRAIRLQSIAREFDVSPARLERTLETFSESDVADSILSAEQVERELDFRLPMTFESGTAMSITVVGQIDCLIRTSDGKWKLIDFKVPAIDSNDAQWPAQRKVLLERYSIQLQLYALACREIFAQSKTKPDVTAELVILGRKCRTIAVDVGLTALAELRTSIKEKLVELRDEETDGRR
ncbi:UvrD-helicase domain-containing protein [Stratiformator vulcanicus]|uniref:DNA 3'-5' helicase n=1 Tax=Stratiformator vulcanicus TaxID=2527980 RepID=A0A517R2D3_9PLAN|nr:UvrD-helicase domain-containing protein [Stratiformator vulcanicus]QDT38040.1 ATP-dependent helicase/nuclease subunit A [Stratiformator vulcanicus]